MKEISKEMDEFLDKVDKLCWEYHYEMLPVNDTIVISGEDGEMWQVTFIDGDGRGK